MKFDFKIQPYQTEAVKSIIDVFKQELFNKSNVYKFDYGNIAQRQQTFDINLGKYNKDDGLAYSNHPITLSPDQLLSNIRNIQTKSSLKLSEKLDKTLGKCALDIEMETGTGKTYVYIKTMFELNKHYGWSKFIVVVPSIAIREGVKKSFEMTEDHFMEQYGKKARYFIYNSSDLQKLDDFSQGSGINVMIINSQAFASSLKEGASNKESRIIYSERDEFQSRRPIDVIAANNPIIILDEPQKLLGTAKKKSKTLEALEKHFNALFSLYFSATHKVEHNLIFSLDALDAYNEKLVKKIEVKGLEVHNLNGTSCYAYLEDFVLGKGDPQVKMEIDVSHANGIKRETHTMGLGYNLHNESNGLEAYKDVFISNIDPSLGIVELSNGTKLHTGEVIGDLSKSNLRRVQIRETITSHLDKEERLYKKGIKCLSLFFIDEVAEYRQYDDEGNPTLGEYGKIFEEEYSRILRERRELFDPEYITYLDSIPVQDTHTGYFSVDKNKRAINSSVKKGSEYSDDIDAYDLILKNKERLLSFEEPTRFIFSHSALSEGWDNPNVFQICALKHSDSSVRKRQEVGRGLRLCVDENGTRMDLEECGELIHDINKLTVIASEGYDEFVKGLQAEIKEVIRERPSKLSKELFIGRKITIEGTDVLISDDIARKIYQHLVKADFVDENDRPTDKCIDAIESGTLYFDPNSPLAQYSEALVDIVRVVVEGGTLETMIDNGHKPRIRENNLNENFKKKEFQALWNEINHKYTYRVDFDSEELIHKAAKAIDDELSVSKLSYVLKTGSQKSKMEETSIKNGTSFESKKVETKELKSSGSTVKYDLIGEISTKSKITRHTAVAILKAISEKKFNMFNENPEEFISKVTDIIKEQKATLIVDHITYNKLEDKYDSSIFTESKANCDPDKAYKGNKHILDFVFTDGLSKDSVEKRFAESLDKAEEVCVYAKLPRGFKIPTPVGDYTPDWAIAFDDSKGIKHIFFIAETKGTMDTMQLKPIEKAKIHCAEQVFNFEGSKVRYHHVDTYQNLLNLIRDMD